ncbi:MAG: TRAP transporter substrate-binding protein [Leptospiraceae bacterium]|nr:TRAP transporter substrate-binding protein [Leptospiraceae bacterium]
MKFEFSRKGFLKKLFFTSSSVLLLRDLFSQAKSLPKIEWRCVSSYPRSLDTIYGSAEVMAEYVRKMTNGKFNIRVYPAGELVPGLQVMDAVQNASVEMAHTASYYFTGKSEALAFDTAVPFGLTARQQNAWLYHGGGLQLIREIYSEFNIINFPGGNTGAQMGGWFRKEVNTLADLKGLKMRIPGLGGKVMSALGVNVQVLAGGDIYPALERGAIDATEWVGPYDDEKLGFYKVAKYYYYPGWWEPGTTLTFLVNKKSWESLPENYKAILEAACGYANVDMVAKYDAKNPEALQKMLKQGVQLRKFSDEIMNEAYKKSVEIMEELASKDKVYKKVYDSWKKFRGDINDWFKTTELTYASFGFNLK